MPSSRLVLNLSQPEGAQVLCLCIPALRRHCRIIASSESAALTNSTFHINSITTFSGLDAPQKGQIHPEFRYEDALSADDARLKDNLLAAYAVAIRGPSKALSVICHLEPQ